MAAGGKRPGAGRPKGSRALTLLASAGERMGFYEAVRHYDQDALRPIASVMMDDKQPASLRLAAANDLLDRGYGKPPQAVAAHFQQPTKRILEVRWMPPDPNDRSRAVDLKPGE